jgi:4-amino-4-deoxychorismate lyase
MILVNGEPQDTISANDRGLAYGDGVFRTLAVRGGKALCWRLHYAKLCGDCERLAIPAPDEGALLDDIASATQEMAECAVKIIVTRGAGERGYALPVQVRATRIVISSPLPAYPDKNATLGIKAQVCELRLADQPRLAGIKHLNRLENVLARAEWSDPSIAEGLLLDQYGNVIEGVASNLFIILRGVIVTPALSRCGVAGVTRDRILAWARDTAMPSEIREIPLAELLIAEEVMMCNSLIGVWQVREIDGKYWECGTHTLPIRKYLMERHA